MSAPSEIKLVRFNPLRRGDLRGYATVRIARSLLVSGVSVYVNGTETWAFIAEADDREGPNIIWRSNGAAAQFSKTLIKLINARYPGALS